VLLIILIVLAVLAFGGGFYNPTFRGPGIGLGTILVIVLIIYLVGGFR
jgi:hypothetical protein